MSNFSNKLKKLLIKGGLLASTFVATGVVSSCMILIDKYQTEQQNINSNKKESVQTNINQRAISNGGSSSFTSKTIYPNFNWVSAGRDSSWDWTIWGFGTGTDGGLETTNNRADYNWYSKVNDYYWTSSPDFFYRYFYYSNYEETVDLTNIIYKNKLTNTGYKLIINISNRYSNNQNNINKTQYYDLSYLTTGKIEYIHTGISYGRITTQAGNADSIQTVMRFKVVENSLNLTNNTGKLIISVNQGSFTFNDKDTRFVAARNGDYTRDNNGYWEWRGTETPSFYQDMFMRVKFYFENSDSNFNYDSTSEQQTFANNLKTELSKPLYLYVDWVETYLSYNKNQDLIREELNKRIVNVAKQMGLGGYYQDDKTPKNFNRISFSTSQTSTSIEPYNYSGTINSSISYLTVYSNNSFSISTPIKIFSNSALNWIKTIQSRTNVLKNTNDYNLVYQLYDLIHNKKQTLNISRNNYSQWKDIFDLIVGVFEQKDVNYMWTFISSVDILGVNYEHNNNRFKFNMKFYGTQSHTTNDYYTFPIYIDDSYAKEDGSKISKQTIYLNEINKQIQNQVELYMDNTLTNEQTTQLESNKVDKNLFEKLLLENDTEIDYKTPKNESGTLNIKGVNSWKITDNINTYASNVIDSDKTLNFKIDTTNTDTNKSIWIDNSLGLKIIFSDFDYSNGNLTFNQTLSYNLDDKSTLWDSGFAIDEFTWKDTIENTKTIFNYSEIYIDYNKFSEGKIAWFELDGKNISDYIYFIETKDNSNITTDIKNVSLSYNKENNNIDVNWTKNGIKYSSFIDITKQFRDYNSYIRKQFDAMIVKLQDYLENTLTWDYLSKDNIVKTYQNMIKEPTLKLMKGVEINTAINLQPVITKSSDLKKTTVKMSFDYKFTGNNSFIKGLDDSVLIYQDNYAFEFEIDNLIMLDNIKELNTQLINAAKNYNDEVLNYENRNLVNKSLTYKSKEEMSYLLSSENTNLNNKNVLENLFNLKQDNGFDLTNNFFINFDKTQTDLVYNFNLKYYRNEGNVDLRLLEILKETNFTVDLTNWKSAIDILKEYIDDNTKQIQTAINTYKKDFLVAIKDIPNNIEINTVSFDNDKVVLSFKETFTNKTIDVEFKNNGEVINNGNTTITKPTEIKNNFNNLLIFIGAGIGLMILILIIIILIVKKSKKSLKSLAKKEVDNSL